MYYHDSMTIVEARELFDEKVQDIKIGHDVDKGEMMMINAQLDELYNDVSSDYSFWKARLEIIESKINQVEKGEGDVGANTEKRKSRAIKIGQSFPTEYFKSMRLPANYDPTAEHEGDVWNLYEMREDCFIWYNLFQNILNAIDFKSRRMIIVASALKIDGMVSKY